jgi:hypothetical protein
MNHQLPSFILLAVLFAPFAAFAQTEESGRGSTLATLLWSVLPILLVGLFVWWFFKKAITKNQKRTDDYNARQREHMQRVEQLLGRIVAAVERKDKDGAWSG